MDTLAHAKRLEALGFERPKAEGLVHMVKQSIDQEVAKKADLERVETALKSDISSVQGELKRVETALKSDIERVESVLRSEISRVEGELKRVETTLKSEIERVETELKSEIKRVETELKFQIKYLDGRIDNLEKNIKNLDQNIDLKLNAFKEEITGTILKMILTLFTALISFLAFLPQIQDFIRTMIGQS